jgi:phage antirepressor YoqD-like protein
MNAMELPAVKSDVVTMTSLELVGFINGNRKDGQPELRHDHFMAKVPLVLGIEDAPKFRGIYRDSMNRERPCYSFPKREACLMAMSYSYDMQAKVFDRMTELEKEANPVIDPSKLLSDPAAMRSLLLGYTEKVIELESRVEAMQPAVDFLDAVAESDTTYSVAEAAKILGSGQKKLYQWLRNVGMVNRFNTPYQRFIDMGVMAIKLSERTNPAEGAPIVCSSARVTGKGIIYLRERFSVSLKEVAA